MMKWIKYDGDSSILTNLPLGTILKVEYGDKYWGVRDDVKVYGDGCIINNSCGQPNKGWQYGEADWSSLEGTYNVLYYAVPPTEYTEFLEKQLQEIEFLEFREDT